MTRPPILDARAQAWPHRAKEPLAQAAALHAMRIGHSEPERFAAFLRDFGLSERPGQEPDVWHFAAMAGGEVCYIVERAEQTGLNALYFRMTNALGADAVGAKIGAEPVPASLPGGGRQLTLHDPMGHAVVLLWDAPVHAAPPAIRLPDNYGGAAARINCPRPSAPAPANVRRIGHVVRRTPLLREAVEWYVATLGMMASDVQCFDSGEPGLVFLRCDLADQPVDHHSIVFSLSPANMFGHVAFEVDDLDALAQGQQFLRARGWDHRWGLGRHEMGSQLFDYWVSPGGVEHEHYADGDLLTADYPTRYSPFTLGSLWSWGHDLPPPSGRVAIPDRPDWPAGVADELAAVLSAPGRSWQNPSRKAHA